MWLTPEELEAAQSHITEKSDIPLAGDQQEAQVPTSSLDECDHSERWSLSRVKTVHQKFLLTYKHQDPRKNGHLHSSQLFLSPLCFQF
jgi:hypothetical protein